MSVSLLIPNSFQVPNYYADHVMWLLNETELKILLYTIRQTFGFRKDSERISLSEFCQGKIRGGKQVTQGTKVSRGAAIAALDMLLKTRILLLITKGTGRDSNEYGINLDADSLDLEPLHNRKAETSKNVALKLSKANAARAANKSKDLQPAVHPMNRISSSSNEPLAVHPVNHKQFIPRTASSSSNEPDSFIHGNQGIETKKETKGESTPFDSVGLILTDEAKAFEATSDEVQTALRDIFPGLPPMSGVIANLTMYVLGTKAPPAYVRAWPEWFRQRYGGQIASHFKFTDTFHLFAAEGLTPDAWLNGSVGARFVAGCTGNLGHKPVTAQIASRVTAVGHWLDTLMPKDKAQWYNQGATPEGFAKFWGERFKSQTGLPTPDSVMKYWADFTAWRANTGDQKKAKSYCGNCENGWVLPSAPNQSARPCACQAKK